MHQVSNVPELLDGSDIPEIVHNNDKADLAEISPESADNGKSKSEWIMDIVDALMKKKVPQKFRVQQKFPRNWDSFPVHFVTILIKHNWRPSFF